MFETKVDTAKLDLALKLMPGRLKEHVSDAFDHISRHFLKLFVRTRLQGPPGIKGRPHGIFSFFKRASILPQSFDGMGMIIFTDSKIASLHEEGAVLTKAGGGKLAIPLSMRAEMFTASGALKKQYKQPRNIKNVIEMTLNGKSWLVKVKKRSREILPLYVLKNKVRIRPRLGYYATWESAPMLMTRINYLNNAIDAALEEA